MDGLVCPSVGISDYLPLTIKVFGGKFCVDVPVLSKGRETPKDPNKIARLTLHIFWLRLGPK